jgi:probable HAF family extracellular repeat protein
MPPNGAAAASSTSEPCLATKIAQAFSINKAGQVVGDSAIFDDSFNHATEWSGGSVIDLGGLPGYTESRAYGINDAGQVVGMSAVGFTSIATEWSGGSIISLGALPGYTQSVAYSINHAGQIAAKRLVPALPLSGAAAASST